MKIFIALILATLVSGCGSVTYVRPDPPARVENYKIIDKPRETVWNSAIPELSKQFFVINNLDKSSGLINISYTGDPERYIDCGIITSTVQNARGTRTYRFPGATAQQNYFVLTPGVGFFSIDRKMSLDGRVNLIFEEYGPNATKVTANTRYIVQRQISAQEGNSFPRTQSDSISFSTGGNASFPNTGSGASECVATGAFEREVLNTIR